MIDTQHLTFEQGVMVGAGAVCIVLLSTLLIRPWIRAIFSGCPVGLMNILGIRFRGNPVNLLLDAYIILRKGSHDTTMDVVEVIYIRNRRKIRTPEDLAKLTVRHLAEQDTTEDAEPQPVDETG